MSSFVILTDSSADLSASMVQQLDVQVLPLSFVLDGHTYHDHPDNRDMDPRLFYERLRSGDMATTWPSTPRLWSPCSRPGRMC